MAKLLITSVRIIAKTATVTISGSQVEAIGVIASLVLFIAAAAVAVTPLVVANLSTWLDEVFLQSINQDSDAKYHAHHFVKWSIE